MKCRNNDDHHNNYCDGCYQNICSAIQHEDLLFCEYTNRLFINKELYLDFGLISQIHLILIWNNQF